MLQSTDKRGKELVVKLVDFGTSKLLKPGKKLKGNKGTPFYIAPEVIKNSFDEKCDIWSVGIITHAMLTGKPPFVGKSNTAILKAVCKE